MPISVDLFESTRCGESDVVIGAELVGRGVELGRGGTLLEGRGGPLPCAAAAGGALPAVAAAGGELDATGVEATGFAGTGVGARGGALLVGRGGALLEGRGMGVGMR